MTPNEIRRRFPNATESFIQRNASNAHHDSGLRPVQPKPDERLPLADPAQGKEESWHDAACRFEIVFTIYSVHPCDWDGYDIKALQDFLIKIGIVPDDGWKTLSGRVVSRKAATKAEEKTVISIMAL